VADVKLPRGALPAAQLGIVRAATDFGQGNLVVGDHEVLARAALSEALPVIERAVLREAARHILLSGRLGTRLACPACHGKPAFDSYDHATGRAHYQCGCGREWDGSKWTSDDLSRAIGRALTDLARGKPLPDLPPKEN
jgi:hypothetical protein